MDPFALVLLAGLAAIVVLVWLLGRLSGAEPPGLRSAREISETRERLEAEDLEQMLAAYNGRRRVRGQSVLTVEDLEHRVAEDLADRLRQ